MNICGCLIHIAPGQEITARAAIEAFDGAEVHAASEDGRFVVVVEDTPEALASETIMSLHQIPGVLSLTLNFHHFDELSESRPHLSSELQQSSQRPIL